MLPCRALVCTQSASACLVLVSQSPSVFDLCPSRAALFAMVRRVLAEPFRRSIGRHPATATRPGHPSRGRPADQPRSGDYRGFRVAVPRGDTTTDPAARKCGGLASLGSLLAYVSQPELNIRPVAAHVVSDGRSTSLPACGIRSRQGTSPVGGSAVFHLPVSLRNPPAY